MNKTIIIDSNVFVKLFTKEADSDEAKIFFKSCASMQIKMFAPELFKYEIAEVTRYHKGSLHKTRTLLHDFEYSLLSFIDPEDQTWLLAENIVNLGHPKSGFPSMYDSIYHALAIHMEGIFLTADKRHYEKTKQLKHICLLKDWEKIFIE